MQTDLGRRKVDESEGRLWAETKGFHYFETSAQSNTNIQEMFETLVKSIVDVMTSDEFHTTGRTKQELGYTPEQAALVTRIRSCHDNYEILSVSRHCSRYYMYCTSLYPRINAAFDHRNTVLVVITENGEKFIGYFSFRDEINKAYKQLAVLLHPDKNMAPGSEEAFKTIARAREELLRTR